MPTVVDIENSGSITGVGYDQATGTLRIRFRSGHQYDYADVPADVHGALMEAPSKGGFYHTAIKDAFTGHRVEEQPEDEGA